MLDMQKCPTATNALAYYPKNVNYTKKVFALNTDLSGVYYKSSTIVIYKCNDSMIVEAVL